MDKILNSLICAANKRLAAFLQVALTTGARCGEIAQLKWTDINTEKLTISINEAEKDGRIRTIKFQKKQ
jgi:integrase